MAIETKAASMTGQAYGEGRDPKRVQEIRELDRSIREHLALAGLEDEDGEDEFDPESDYEYDADDPWIYRAMNFLAEAPWTVARSGDHAYTVRGETEDSEFEFFVAWVRKYGYDAYFAGRQYRYWEFGPYKYWTMGAPISETTISNRTEVKR